MKFVMTFEGYDWNNSTNLVDGLTYKNVVETKSDTTITQQFIIPTIDKIDVSEDSIRIDQQRLFDEVVILCEEKKDVLKPGYYYSRDVILYFANADDLKTGDLSSEWKGGFMVLYKVDRNPRWKKDVSALDFPKYEIPTISDPSIRYKKDYVEPEPILREPIDPDAERRAIQMRLKPHLRDKQ